MESIAVMFENGTPTAIAGSNDLNESDREESGEVSEAAPAMLGEENLISTRAARQIAPEKTEAGEVAAKQQPKKILRQPLDRAQAKE